MESAEKKPSQEMQAAKRDLLARLAQMTPAGNGQETDALDGYALQLSQSLPALSTESAAACAAIHPRYEAQALYAVVCSGTLPLRLKPMEKLKAVTNPHLCGLVAYGEAWISTLGQRRMVAVFERPKGMPLQELVADGKRYPERFIADHVLSPLVAALQKYHEHAMPHGRIHMRSVYYQDKTMLGEAVTEPCGYSQDFYCEPPERISVLPYAKGESHLTADSYALGLIALQLASGKLLQAKDDPAEFIRRLMHDGAYQFLTANEEFSDHLQDFLRGTLADSPHERWTLAQIRSWLDGKRFNLIQAGAPRDAGRPYVFMGHELGNMRAIAHAYFTHWETAKLDLRDNKLRRWVSTSAHRKELAEQLQRVVNNTGGGSTKNDRLQNELVSRSILHLDPTGPLRYGAVSTEIDGLGGVLAHAYRVQSQDEMRIIADIIDLDLVSIWSGLQKDTGPNEATAQVWKLQRVRMLMRINALGSGMERCLYDLNSTLACMSPLILNHHALTPADVLQALDRVASDKAQEGGPVDRHIAAFLCSRLDVTKDVRVTDLSFAPALMTDPDLIALEILRHAQAKTGNPPLKSLSLWMASRLLRVTDQFHSRELQQSMRNDVMRAASSGILARLSEVILNTEIIRDDDEGYNYARAHYARLAVKIKKLESVEVLTARSREWGNKLALCVSALLLFIVSYNNLISHIGTGQ